MFGQYNKYSQINWDSVERIIFVCMGNICRSAFAEVVARSMNIESISCGLRAIEGVPADKNAIRTAKKMGYDLESHQAMPIMYVSIRKTDLIITMEPWQAKFLGENLNTKQQCTLLGIWGKAAHPYIHDPYGSSSEYFDNCFNLIEKSIYGISEKYFESRKNRH